MYFGTSQVSQEVERSAGKRTPRATSLRVLRVSVCIGPAHAEARRCGERERSAHKAGQTELHSSPEAGASRDTAGTDEDLKEYDSHTGRQRRCLRLLASVPVEGDGSPHDQALAGHLRRRIETQEVEDRRRHIGEPSAVAQRHLPFVQP